MIWKTIPGFENYQVNGHGQIRNIKTNKILNSWNGKKGYQKVTLYNNSNKKALFVHRLVAMSFVPNLEDKPQVNHIDGNKMNNQASNLEWVTGSENVKHAYDSGLNTAPTIQGENNGRAKLTEEQVRDIKNSKGRTHKELAAFFGVSRGHIGLIKRGKSWCHI